MRKTGFFLFLAALWIAACQSPTQEVSQPAEVSAPALDTAALMAAGSQISMATFKSLSGELRAALEEGGVPQAVPYCQVKGLPVADSLSRSFGVSIRRVTDRIRNPLDTMNALESEVFDGYLAAVANDEDLVPVVRGFEPDAYYFAPIVLQDMCLKCHGAPVTDIAPADHELIRQLYPEDQAIGYKPGDLRGMWSIRFPEGRPVPLEQ